MGDLRIGKAVALRYPKGVGIHVVDARPAQRLLNGDHVGHPRQEKRVDARRLMHFPYRPSTAQRTTHIHDTVARRPREQLAVALFRVRCHRMPVGAQSGPAVFQRAQRLPQRFFERAPDGHDLAHGLHARGKRVV